MIFGEEKRDLFEVNGEYALVHCISSDFALGAGIARTFAEMGIRDILKTNYPINHWNGSGYCIFTNAGNRSDRYSGVYNLVTKEKCFHKPTYETLKEALLDMRKSIEKNGCERCKLAMPLIGCGLDRLEWSKVQDIVFEVFRDTNVEILVCRKEW